MSAADIILKEKTFVLRKWVDKTKLLALYEKDHFNDQRCRTCEYKPDRPSAPCENCDAYGGHFKFWSNATIGKESYVALPRGDTNSLKKLIPNKGQLVTVNKRAKPKLRIELELSDKLVPHDYQVSSVDEMIKAKQGILKAPPRSGKTVMAVMLTVKLGLKTLIMAHQTDLLEQFLGSFHDFTNIQDIEKFGGKKHIGLCNKVEDFESYDICLASYQMFITDNGKKRLDAIKDLFGLVIIDEIHKGSANCYSKVINNINSYHRIGLTATPTRKDGLDFVVAKIIGDVKYEAQIITLVPAVKLIHTKQVPKHEYKMWVFSMRWLQDNEERNALIVKHAVKDLTNGRSILIPVTLKKHTQILVDAINKAMGDKVAAAFNGSLSKVNRKKVLDDAKSGAVKCVVGMRSMLTGINIPLWDCLYEVMPISNEPNFMQETARIRTPMEGKPRPFIKFFVDADWGLSRGCFMTCYQTFRKEKMPFTPKSVELLDYIVGKQKRRFSVNSADMGDVTVAKTKYDKTAPRSASSPKPTPKPKPTPIIPNPITTKATFQSKFRL